MNEEYSIEELAARLARLEDERAILRTLHGYGHALDYGHEDDWVGCFTDDGIFDVRARNGATFVRCRPRYEAGPPAVSTTENSPNSARYIGKRCIEIPDDVRHLVHWAKIETVDHCFDALRIARHVDHGIQISPNRIRLLRQPRSNARWMTLVPSVRPTHA